jgi:hypothetical protein
MESSMLKGSVISFSTSEKKYFPNLEKIRLALELNTEPLDRFWLAQIAMDNATKNIERSHQNEMPLDYQNLMDTFAVIFFALGHLLGLDQEKLDACLMETQPQTLPHCEMPGCST